MGGKQWQLNDAIRWPLHLIEPPAAVSFQPNVSIKKTDLCWTARLNFFCTCVSLCVTVTSGPVACLLLLKSGTGSSLYLHSNCFFCVSFRLSPCCCYLCRHILRLSISSQLVPLVFSQRRTKSVQTEWLEWMCVFVSECVTAEGRYCF